MANYGFAFAPTASNQERGAQAANQPPTRSVEIKSLNLPDRGTLGQIAPQALLSAPGGGGMPTAQLLKLLMQAFAPMAGPSAGDPMTAVMQQRAQASAPSAPQMPPTNNTNLAPRVSFGYPPNRGQANPITAFFPPSDPAPAQPELSRGPSLGDQLVDNEVRRVPSRPVFQTFDPSPAPEMDLFKSIQRSYSPRIGFEMPQPFDLGGEIG